MVLAAKYLRNQFSRFFWKEAAVLWTVRDASRLYCALRQDEVHFARTACFAAAVRVRPNGEAPCQSERDDPK